MADFPGYPGVPAPPQQYIVTSNASGMAAAVINPDYAAWQKQWGQAIANQDAKNNAALAHRQPAYVPPAPPQYSNTGTKPSRFAEPQLNSAYADWQKQYAQQIADNQKIQQARDDQIRADRARAQDDQAARDKIIADQAAINEAAHKQADPNYIGEQGAMPGSADYSSALHAYNPYKQVGGKWFQYSRTGKNEGAVNNVVIITHNGQSYYVADGGNGATLGLYTPPKGKPFNPSDLAGPGGGTPYAPSWYEKQQVGLDKQRISQAENAQKWQQSQAVLQQAEAASHEQQTANQSFRDAQLKSTYGSISNADSGVPQIAPIGGYTGGGYDMSNQPNVNQAQAVPPPVPQTPVAPIPTASPVKSMAAGGNVTWYEQQQIILDKQRLKDSQAAQAWQVAQALQQKKLVEGQAIDSARDAFTNQKLQTLYGTNNGMAWGAAKGARVLQQLPEPTMLASGYNDLKIADPWKSPAVYGGYTGSGYMDAQHTGNYSLTDPSMAIPQTGNGSIIPTAAKGGDIPYFPNDNFLPTSPYNYGNSTTGGQIPGYAAGGDPPGQPPGGNIPGSPGQPQLIMAHGGEHITPAPGTPLPALLGSPGGAPFSNPTDPNDPMNPGSPTAPSGNIQQSLMALIQAAQALVSDPDFSSLGIPIAPPSGDDGSGGSPTDTSAGVLPPDASDGPPGPSGAPTGGPPVPGMAAGGTVSLHQREYLKLHQGTATNMIPPVGGWTTSTPRPAATLAPIGGGNQSSWSSSGPRGIPNWLGGGVTGGPPQPTTNAYGQTNAAGVTHAPTNNDIVAGPGVLNHQNYSPTLTGLSGYGATITPNGTPVVMSQWQRAHLDPSSISGPGGYDDYAMQVAGWSPADLQAKGQNLTGGFGTDLSAPKNYAPIPTNIAPAGG